MMIPKQIDALGSFQHIVDNVPVWQPQIEQLRIYAAAKYEEYVAAYAKLLHHAQVRSRRQKSASIASLRSSDEGTQPPLPSLPLAEVTIQAPKPSPSFDSIDLNPLEAGTRFIYAQAQRKRKTTTSVRSNGSGPRQHRTKQMIIIHYDSHIQVELDTLVKGFGVARNNLRKGKNAYNAAKGFALPALSRRYDNVDHLVPNPMSRHIPRLTKTSSDSSVISSTQVVSAEVAFIKLDKEIEQVQSLCETAAHQAIRDGDCKAELTEALSKLQVILAMAESTLDLLKTEKMNTEDDVGHLGESNSISDTTSAQSTLCEKPSFEALSLANKVLPPVMKKYETSKLRAVPATIPAPIAPLLTDAIEVDDDEDDGSIDIDLNLSNYRAAGRRMVS